ncbi:tyrosine-protein kinase JAK3-like [Paramacrobiotus metropolitanus]|uniref:tyrosine-protein kinase JAK3-like n=1 Tax=Paramacrobiotus metropolitanus TaxID=2943436 RepID=UPI0024458BF1|nr:tyrosine-protein kinase JAK3-like [Paramacrobiotus metropolitanus]
MGNSASISNALFEVIGPNMEYPDIDDSPGEIIAWGSFGHICVANVKVTHRGEYTGADTITVKQIRLYNDAADFTDHERWMQALQRLRTLTELMHENLVVYHQVLICAAKGAIIQLATDYHDTNLTNYLRNVPEKGDARISYEKVIQLAKQITRGLEYLHSNDLTHGDLNPAYIWVRTGPDNLETLLISDLDGWMLMRDIVRFDRFNILRDIPYLRFMSPEMVRFFQNKETSEIGSQTDIWSLGCIILQMVENFLHITNNRLVKGVCYVDSRNYLDEVGLVALIADGYAPHVSDDIDENLAGIIQQCLDISSLNRLSTGELLNKLQKINIIVDPIDDLGSATIIGSNMQYRYSHVDYIGRGSFGIVYKAKVTKQGSYIGQKFIAVKVMHMGVQSKGPNEGESWMKTLKRLRKLTELSHKHLVAYFKISIVDAPGGATVELAMNYHKGDLASYLEEAKKSRDLQNSYTHKKVIKFTIHLARRLEYLHWNSIIHGDLKPENILVQIMNHGREKLLIGDLDDLVQMRKSHTCSGDILQLRGTTRYMSPEMLRKFTQVGDEQPGRKTDIWSLGCIILDMVEALQNEPVKRLAKDGNIVDAGSDLPSHRYVHLIINGFVPLASDSVEKNLARLIGRCLNQVSNNRISAHALLGAFRKEKKHVIVFFAHKRLTTLDKALLFDPLTVSFEAREKLGAPTIPPHRWSYTDPILPGLKSEIMFCLRTIGVAGHADDTEHHFWNVVDGTWRTMSPMLSTNSFVVKRKLYVWDGREAFMEMDAFTGSILSIRTPPRINLLYGEWVALQTVSRLDISIHSRKPAQSGQNTSRQQVPRVAEHGDDVEA